MRVFQDGSRRSSRCKPGDWNFGGVAIAARKRASGVWEEENSVGESAPIADAFALRDHTRERKNNEEGKKKGKDEVGGGGGEAAPALLLTRVVVVRSVPGSRPPPPPVPAPPAPPGPVAAVAAFESCMLTMRTERSVGLGLLRKARVSVVDDLRWRWLLLRGLRGPHHHQTSLLC
jgi:hypothetical protein